VCDDKPGAIALVDLADLSLKALEAVDEPHLRKVLESVLGDDNEPIAGFNSSI
jgi:FXSXX-COOH protein